MLTLLLLLAQEEDSTASFKTWKPATGTRSVLKSEDAQSSWIKLSRGEAARPTKTEKSHAFEATQEILDVEGYVPTRCRRVYTKASYRKNLWEKPFDFQGATVLFVVDPDGPREVSREDKKFVSAEDVGVLRMSFLDTELDKGGRAVTGEPLWPKNPLRVGETADLPPEDGARVLGGYDFRDSIDPKSSAMKVTFKSAATRSGARFATLVFTGHFLLRRFAEFDLDSPIPAKITYTLDACVDGTRPDNAYTVALEMKGSSGVPLAGGNTGSLEIEIRRDLRFSLRGLERE
jgi:hypothetical protein